MAERPDERGRPVPADEFESYMLAQVRSNELHFPKAILVPPGEPGGARAWLEGAWRVFLMPAFAYSLVLALLVPAYLGVAQRRSGGAAPAPVPASPAAALPLAPPPTAVAQGTPALGMPRVIDLGGGPVRGSAGGVSRVTIGDADDFVLLSFLAPTRSDPRVVYEAVLADGAGRTVATRKPLRSTDGQGRFTLVCESRLLAAGDYVLTVSQATEDDAQDGPYRFPFRVIRLTP